MFINRGDYECIADVRLIAGGDDNQERGRAPRHAYQGRTEGPARKSARPQRRGRLHIESQQQRRRATRRPLACRHADPRSQRAVAAGRDPPRGGRQPALERQPTEHGRVQGLREVRPHPRHDLRRQPPGLASIRDRIRAEPERVEPGPRRLRRFDGHPQLPCREPAQQDRRRVRGEGAGAGRRRQHVRRNRPARK